jgi:phosphatidylinositol alpha-1,6-mannosyltransferase
MKTNLLFITTKFPPSFGGISTYSYELSRHLADEFEKVIILTLSQKDHNSFDLSQKFEVIRVPRIPILSSFLLLLFSFVIIPKYKINKIFASSWFTEGVIAYACSRICRIDYYIGCHGWELNVWKKTFFRRRLMLMTLKNARFLFAVSNCTKLILLSLGIFNEKIIIIPNGIDFKRFSKKINASMLVENYGLKNRKILLTVASLIKMKGVDLVIKSLPEVLGKVPDAVYIIVGDGPERKNLEDLAIKLGLREKVIFVGSLKYPSEKLLEFYVASDLFVLSSYQVKDDPRIECFGIVFLEAMASGKPVIGTDSGGIKEVIVDNKTGLLVKQGNIKSLSAAIISLLSNKRLAEKFGNAGIKHAKKFDWEIIAEKYSSYIGSF